MSAQVFAFPAERTPEGRAAADFKRWEANRCPWQGLSFYQKKLRGGGADLWAIEPEADDPLTFGSGQEVGKAAALEFIELLASHDLAAFPVNLLEALGRIAADMGEHIARSAEARNERGPSTPRKRAARSRLAWLLGSQAGFFEQLTPFLVIGAHNRP